MQLDIRELLLGTLDPARVQASTATIQELKGSPEFANLLYAHLLNDSNDEQSRYLASIYFSQIFKNPLSHEQDVLLHFFQSVFHSFCSLPVRVRRVIKDCLAATLCHLYQSGKLPSLYSDCASLILNVLRSSNIDPMSYQSALSVDVLLALGDLIFLSLPFITHTATVELDDVIVSKLQSIINSTSDVIISLLTLANACFVASVVDQASFLAYQHFLCALYSFLLSMYSLDDLPTVYKEQYLYIATKSMIFLDINSFVARGFDITDPVVSDVCKKIIDMLCNSISVHTTELEEHAPSVIKLLIDMACSYVNAMDNKTFDIVLTDVLFHLHFFSEGLESRKYIYTNAVQLMDRVVFSALKLTRSDLASIDAEDPQHICGLLSASDTTSRRAACEGILRAICKGLPDIRAVAMQKAQESIASLNQGVGTLEWFISLCHALSFYRAVVIKQISSYGGVTSIVPDSNLESFYAAVIIPSLGISYVHTETDSLELSAAKTLALCEVMRFVTDFRDVLTEEQFAGGLQALIQSINCNHNNVSNTVLASCLSTIMQNCKHKSVLAQFEPRFLQFLSVFISLGVRENSNCLLLNSGTNYIHIAHAFSVVLNFVSKSIAASTLAELISLFFTFVFPVCLQRKERLNFVSKLFESVVVMFNSLSDKAAAGLQLGADMTNELIKAFASLYEVIEAEEDWMPMYLQLLTPIMQLASLTGAFTEEIYPLLFGEVLPVYMNIITLPFTAATPACALAMNAFVSLAVVHNKPLLTRVFTVSDGTSMIYIERIVRFGTSLVVSSNFKIYGYGLLTTLSARVPEYVLPDIYKGVLEMVQKDLKEVQGDRKLLGVICFFFVQYAFSCDPSTINSTFIVEQLLVPFAQKVFLRDPIIKDIVILLAKLATNQLDESVKWDIMRCIGVLSGHIRRKIDLGSRQQTAEGAVSRPSEKPIVEGGALFVEIKEIKGTWLSIPVPPDFVLSKHVADTVGFDFQTLSA